MYRKGQSQVEVVGNCNREHTSAAQYPGNVNIYVALEPSSFLRINARGII